MKIIGITDAALRRVDKREGSGFLPVVLAVKAIDTF